MTMRVAVAGASGYAGGEVLRLLAQHPEFEVVTVAGHSSAGKSLISQQPHLRSLAHLTLEKITPEVLDGHDAVFFALPHGVSGEITAQLKNVRLVVDCGADHRLERETDWEAFYGSEYHGHWAYGVPELPVGDSKQREQLKGATRIAAPGCNASTVALSLAPGINANLIESSDIVVSLAVGPSGAGKVAKPHLIGAELMGSANPYAVGNVHRHIPEIAQALRNAAPKSSAQPAEPAAMAEPTEPTLTMTPVLVPMARGILATSTAKLKAGVTAAEVRAAWERAYAGEAFVHVLPAGEHPKTQDTIGANTCLMSVTVDETTRRVIVVAALDNLVKGTAGAAIQSANIALGLNEQLGLTVNGVAP